MAYKIVIEAGAQTDIQRAIDYYEGKRSGLGEKFELALNEHLLSISKKPFYQVFYKDYRALVIKGFPFYQIIYYLNEKTKTAFVDAVFHCAQDPEKKP